MLRTYTELSQLTSLEDRYEYLRLDGRVAETTFGFDRWVNQAFYRSYEWKQARQAIIARDLGMEYGTPDVPIQGTYYIHHMNPITMQDIEEGSDNLLDPEFLITCGLNAHNAVHFGDKSQLPQPYIPRTKSDTKLW